MGIEDRIYAWLQRRAKDRLLERCGMICTCPWCRQTMQQFSDTQLCDESDTPFTVFTCGNCGGESVWEFGPVWLWRRVGEPPFPAWPNAAITSE